MLYEQVLLIDVSCEIQCNFCDDCNMQDCDEILFRNCIYTYFLNQCVYSNVP